MAPSAPSRNGNALKCTVAVVTEMPGENTDSVPIVEGETIAGKYRVGRILGQGGMGVVVAATHLQLDQRVALKFLLPEAVKHAEIVARFSREARAAARIRSEHVARVLDVGELQTGAPYMVMEYLEGEDLEKTLARHGALPVVEAVEYLLQGCEAVAEAHALGIVHRDLKPANLFLAQRPGRRPIVKVLDFGISKAPASTNNPRLTQTAAMFGSPPYMSPEQIRSTGSVDVRSDIWSLGAVLYEMTTLRKPFPSESAAELLVAILHQDPVAPRAHRPDIPPLLDAAILRCLQKDAALRFQDVAALAAAIGPFGPPSSADMVGRISHVLGIGRAPAPPSLVAGSPSADQHGLGGMRTAVMPAQPVIGGTAVLASSDVEDDSLPVVRKPAAPGRPRPPAVDRRLRVIVVASALLIAMVSGGAYWFGTRHATNLVAPSPVGTAASPLPGRSVETAKPVEVAKSPLPIEPAAPPRTAPAHQGGVLSREHGRARAVRESATCAELLERMSLGESLSPQDKAAYARQCNKR